MILQNRKSFKLLKVLLGVFFMMQVSFANAQLLQPGDTAPDFTVTDVHGVTHNLYNYLNQGKYVMLKFGWLGCPTCDLSRPAYNSVYYNFGCNQRDLVCLEFDLQSPDSAFSSMSAFVSYYYSIGGVFNGLLAATDSLALFPRAPYISYAGNSVAVTNMYGVSEFTHEFIIEPVNKTILGTSEGIPDTNGVIQLTPGWPTYFNSMIGEGSGVSYGYGLTGGIEQELPNVFHYIPRAFMTNYLSTIPGSVCPLTTVPFQALCQSTLSGCDTLRPNFTNYTVSPLDDTSRKVTINWTSPSSALCNSYEVKYSPKGQSDTFNHIVITSANSLTVSNLIPGDYDFYIKCSCNQLFNYDKMTVRVESDTDFSSGDCASCNYTLLLYYDQNKSMWFDGSINLFNSKFRIKAGGKSEYFVIGSNDHDSVDGKLMVGRKYPLKFCKNDSVSFRMYEIGIGYNFGTYGYRLYDGNNNIVSQYYGDTVFTPAYPNYEFTDRPSISANCNPLAVHQVSSSNEFELMPNPAYNGRFNLYMTTSKPEEYQMTIYDILGNVLMNEQLNVNGKLVKQINLDAKSKGVYMVKLQNAREKLFRKIVLE